MQYIGSCVMCACSVSKVAWMLLWGAEETDRPQRFRTTVAPYRRKNLPLLLGRRQVLPHTGVCLISSRNMMGIDEVLMSCFAPSNKGDYAFMRRFSTLEPPGEGGPHWVNGEERSGDPPTTKPVLYINFLIYLIVGFNLLFYLFYIIF